MERERAAAAGIPRPTARVGIDDHTDDATFDRGRWTTFVATVLALLDVPASYEVDVTFVGTDEIAELNRLHMGADGPTDVLSFPIDGDLVASRGERPIESDDSPPILLGDVFICLEVAAANAPGHAGSLDDEIALLVVHALLHLLGHDHAEADDRLAMQALERELLTTAYGPLGGDPWAS